MWPFRKKSRKSRSGPGKVPRAAVRAWDRLRRQGVLVSLFLGGVFFLGALAMDVWPLDPLPFHRGQYVPEDLYSRTTFSILRPDRLEDYIRQRKEALPATFQLNASRVEEILSILRSLPERLRATSQPADLEENLRTQLGLGSPKLLKQWQSYAEPAARQKYAEQLDRLQKALQRTPLVRQEEIENQRKRLAGVVLLVDDDSPQPIQISDLVPTGRPSAIARQANRLAALMDAEVRLSVESYLLSALTRGEPLYRYDPAKTQADLEQLVDRITREPPRDVYETREAGKLLVMCTLSRPVGEPPGLTDTQLEDLRKEQRAYLRALWGPKPWLPWASAGGRAGLLLLVTVLMGLYLARYYPRMVEAPTRILGIVAVLLLMLGLNKVLLKLPDGNPLGAVLPILAGTMILAIAYEQRSALLLGMMLSLGAVLQGRGDLMQFLVLVSAVSASVFQLREIRTRGKVIRAAMVAGLVACGVALSAALFRSVPWRFALLDGAWALAPAVLAGFLIQGILPPIERIFRTVTSMTLLEWCDASKPLLKRLATEAPGTFSHSLQLGAMCEAAAEAIGARGLLARVGAYYHDIGKLNKPEYFIENLFGGPSKHEKLSPAMSLLIVTGHVRDGLELARQYGLPKVLWEFIASHHGTTLVQYFYQAAAEQRKADAERAPDEVEFRYGGPKPSSQEAAILMLADASESSLRSLADPTPGRIENQVHAMTLRRLMDGQLDECDLTLRQVHAIEESLVKSLLGIYHARVAYPTPAGERPAAAEMFPRAAEKGPSQPSAGGRA